MRLADGLTAPVVIPPTRPFCGRGGFPPPRPAAPPTRPTSADAGVTVLRQEVVGPYAVSIIRGTDPMAMRDWLRSNGCTVPSAVEPVVDDYAAMNMDYIALRLRPARGIDRMTPCASPSTAPSPCSRCA